MKQKVTYLETGSVDPAFNLAFEEYVLCNRNEGDYLILWQNKNTIVVGQNQNTMEEINQAFVREHGIHVVRRSTGGGAVYHDLGNLNYSFITDVGDKSRVTINRFTAPVVNALRELGLEAETSGRNDILVSGKKVSGTAQRIVGTRILHHGTLLFDSNLEMISGALRVDPEKFRSKSTKSVRSRVANICSLLPERMDLQDFWVYLKEAFSGEMLTEGILTTEEMNAVRELRDRKYTSWNWIYGRSPAYDVVNRRYWDGGCLEFRARIEHGIITDVWFYGDFLSVSPLDELRKALKGRELKYKEIEDVLGYLPLSSYLGSITKEEVLQTIFDL